MGLLTLHVLCHFVVGLDKGQRTVVWLRVEILLARRSNEPSGVTMVCVVEEADGVSGESLPES